ncbi:hypothetical protein JRQ81_017020 [Phrynocephalus forsythii]|uniref:Uncharacterized protein n=1 Tax=Phrynocephalus forsythii TaxID=171643 RepID=A0A9Q1B1P3_9SAUR|nr:hypothetical protein JRQ81_017020 [Phrynocephalus forsythii]
MSQMVPNEPGGLLVPETLRPDTDTAGPSQSASPSMQILNLVLESRDHSIHQQLGELSLSTIYSLLATLMQCLSLGGLCVAISLLKWIVMLQPFFHRPSVLVTFSFGVPYDVSVYEPWNPNATDSRKYYLFSDEDNNIIEPVMTSVCFMSLLSGFLAFLLGFVEVKKLGQNQTAIVTFLHILSGLFLIGLIVLCCWCLVKIQHRINEDAWKIFQLKAIPGESFYSALMSCVIIVIAVVFSLRSMTLAT